MNTMKKPYNPSTVEQWVSDKFIQVGIIHPSDLKLKMIANSFGIDYSLWHGITYSYRDPNDGKQYIMDNENLDEVERRKRFFHELDHILRHAGDQRNMCDSFRMMQEADAKLFTMYASIPYHMIDFENGYTVQEIMDRFYVTKEIAYKRIDDIKQKIYWARKNELSKVKSAYRPFSLDNCSDETKQIMAKLSKIKGVNYL
jgi:Zn-dependent peptidase ImmA (M78 family)